MNTGAIIPRDGDRIMAFGAPGYGKTTLVARALVRDFAHSGRFGLIYDPAEEIGRYLTGGSKGGWKLPDPSIVRYVQTAEEALQYANHRSYLSHGLRPHRVFVIPAKQKMLAKAEMFVRAVNDERTRGWILCGDEAELLYGNRGIDTEDRLAGLKFVRNRQQRLYLIGHRAQWMSALSRVLADHVCLFQTDSETATEGGMREWGPAQNFEDVKHLEKFEYLYRQRGAHAPYPLYNAIEDRIPWP